MLSFTPYQFNNSVQYSSVYYLLCLMQFCKWFRPKREIEDDIYFMHELYKHADKYLPCHRKLFTYLGCGINSGVDRRSPKKNIVNDSL